MQITRLEVEEGFLDGLDLAFSPGLNVLIGSRGTGKTSVVELLRWALGVPAFSSAFDERTRKHVAAVLGSGRVTVSVEIDGDEVKFARSLSDPMPKVSALAEYERPLVLSQNEIELLGLQADGRLRLVDGFRVRGPASSEVALLAEVGSLTAQIASTTTQIVELEQGVANLGDIEKRLSEAKDAQTAFEDSLAGLSAEQQRLSELGKSLATRTSDVEAFRALESALAARYEQLTSSVVAWPQIPPLVNASGVAAEITSSLAEVDDLVRLAASRLASVITRIESEATILDEAVSADETEARELRRLLDQASQGSGAAARQVAELESLREKAVRAQTSVRELRDRRAELVSQRQVRLTQLDQSRRERVAARAAVVGDLNAQFGPAIAFRLDEMGDIDGYVRALTETLRGSGVHYNALAPTLASSVSPAELIEIVESFNVQALVDASGLPSERAARVISGLAAGGLDQIATADIGDRVEISLLDGGRYKSSSEMSTGQRCTAVLPVLLRHDDRVVVIDQPEDNLDTAYIVNTVVRAVSSRRPGSQLICATHNPNIPVLGEASQVIQLGSDGRRGFVERKGRLVDPEIVEAILTVMEGGAEAFDRRSKFYGTQGG